MQSGPTIGIALPLQVLAWEDESGQAWVAYNDPAFLSERHGITDRTMVFDNMAQALKGLTDAATGASP